MTTINIPKWIKERYILLWNNFKSDSFTIEKAFDAINSQSIKKIVTIEDLNKSLNELSKFGWLTINEEGIKREFQLKSEGEVFLNFADSVRDKIWLSFELYEGIGNSDKLYFSLFSLFICFVAQNDLNLKNKLLDQEIKIDTILFDLEKKFELAKVKINQKLLIPDIFESFIANIKLFLNYHEFTNKFEELIYFSMVDFGRDSISTPQSLNELLVDLASIKDSQNILDPCVGFGDILYTINKQNFHDLQLFGQDINTDYYNICKFRSEINKMNAILNNADSLLNLFEDKRSYMKFDRVITIPPFGMSFIKEEVIRNTFFQERFPFSKVIDQLPGRFSADYLWIQLALSSLKQDGKAVLVVPSGILFRGGKEAEIRKDIILNDKIETIIQLPSNSFPNTAIPPVIIILQNQKPIHLVNKIFIIDASDEYEALTKMLITVKKDFIMDIYSDTKEIDGISKVIDLNEIVENDFILTVNRFISKTPPVEKIDYSKIIEDYNNNYIALQLANENFTRELKKGFNDIEKSMNKKSWNIQKISSICKILRGVSISRINYIV